MDGYEKLWAIFWVCVAVVLVTLIVGAAVNGNVSYLTEHGK